MLKIVLISLCFTASLILAIKDESLDTEKLNIIEHGEIDSDGKSGGSQRKRDSGYFYPRPDRVKSRGRYMLMRLPFNTVRPFKTYGPPKQTSLQNYIKPNRPHNNNRNKYDSNRLPINSPTQTSHRDVPSPIRLVDFVTASPIASQNEVPFKQNANYLPPKNQKLPVSTVFQQFTNQQLQQQQFNPIHTSSLQKLVENSRISDATLFLTQNAKAISRLYDTPATNINYEPQNDSQDNHHHQQQNYNSQNLQFFGPLPAYSSGILGTPQSSEQFYTTKEHQQDTSRYAENNHDYTTKNQRFLSSISTLDKPDGCNNNNDHNNNDIPTLLPANPSYGVASSHDPPGHTTTLPVGLPSTFPFPQYAGGFAPTLIADTNFVSGLPSNYGTIGHTTSGGSSPTHFGIPIPTTSNKPAIVHPILLPTRPIHTPPIAATPVQPIFPITQTQHPTYGVQPSLVNSVVLKPVKPLYPVYLYPNVGYALSKPTLSTLPWNYAPSYAQTKSVAW